MSQLAIPFLHGQISPKASAVAVIMAGGSGTRFWPVSRTQYPKQFLPFGDSERSLLQETARRIEPLVGVQATLVVTTEHQIPLVEKQLPEAAIVGEPAGRNTAACLGMSALAVYHAVGDVPLICLPSDHMIWREEVLRSRLQLACECATQDDLLLTIGIPPTAPETGYGYIQSGDLLGNSIYSVKQFVEKPDRERALRYLAAGDFFWNSGMFVWRPSVLLRALEQHQPELFRGLEELYQAAQQGKPVEKLQERYRELPSISIDFGVMEKASNVVMLSGEGFRWSDVGSWDSWAENLERISGSQDPICVGDGVFVDTERCAVFSRSKRVLALVGVHDLVVVDTDDAVLVCHRHRAQDVKQVVEILKKNGRTDLL